MGKKSGIEPAGACRETAGRLLDAAERLFGEHGFDGVGMRALAEEAGVNLGAATYHYGSKQALYVEAFMRRFRPANAERLRLLREAQAGAGGKGLAVEAIVDCLLRPPYLSGRAHPNFNALLVRNLTAPPPFMRAVMHREIGPNIEVFIEALRAALPGVPEDLVGLRVFFAMGALTMFTVLPGPIKEPRFAEIDENAFRELVRFIAAGLTSVPAVRPSARPAFPRPPKPKSSSR